MVHLFFNSYAQHGIGGEGEIIVKDVGDKKRGMKGLEGLKSVGEHEWSLMPVVGGRKWERDGLVGMNVGDGVFSQCRVTIERFPPVGREEVLTPGRDTQRATIVDEVHTGSTVVLNELGGHLEGYGRQCGLGEAILGASTFPSPQGGFPPGLLLMAPQEFLEVLDVPRGDVSNCFEHLVLPVLSICGSGSGVVLWPWGRNRRWWRRGRWRTSGDGLWQCPDEVLGVVGPWGAYLLGLAKFHFGQLALMDACCGVNLLLDGLVLGTEITAFGRLLRLF